MYKDTDRNFKSWKRQSAQDIFLALLVLFLPAISFVHLLFSKELDQLIIFGIQIHHGFADNQVFTWFFLFHFSSFLFALLILCFSRGFWRYALLAPICYFIAYPFWMFTDGYLQFSDFLFSGTGLMLFMLVIVVVLRADAVVKAKLVDRDIRLSFEAGCREFFDAWNSRCNRAIRTTLDRKAHLTLREYIHRIYFYAVLVEKRGDDENKQEVNPAKEGGKYRNLLICGCLITLFLILFSPHWVPAGEIQIEFFGFELNSFGFRDLKTFSYYVTHKFVMLTLGLIWLTTSRFWWRGALLSPIMFYLYQFLESFYPTSSLDGEGNLNVMPLVLITLLAVILLWALIRRISVNRDYQDLLNRELEVSLQELSREEARGRLLQMHVHSPEIL